MGIRLRHVLSIVFTLSAAVIMLNASALAVSAAQQDHAVKKTSYAAPIEHIPPGEAGNGFPILPRVTARISWLFPGEVIVQGKSTTIPLKPLTGKCNDVATINIGASTQTSQAALAEAQEGAELFGQPFVVMHSGNVTVKVDGHSVVAPYTQIEGYSIKLGAAFQGSTQYSSGATQISFPAHVPGGYITVDINAASILAPGCSLPRSSSYPVMLAHQLAAAKTISVFG